MTKDTRAALKKFADLAHKKTFRIRYTVSVDCYIDVRASSEEGALMRYKNSWIDQCADGSLILDPLVNDFDGDWNAHLTQHPDEVSVEEIEDDYNEDN